MLRATLAIQVLPLEAPEPRRAIDAAIEVIRESGLVFEVGAMETTIEGDNLNELLEVAARAHGAAIYAGAEAVQSNIRMLERPAGLDSMRERLAPFREVSPK